MSKKNINNLSFTRAWLISDIHLGVRAASENWLDIAEKYFYNFLIPLIEKNSNSSQKDVLIVMGDVFDNRSSLNLRVLNTGIKIFEDLSVRIPIILFPGNHDLYRINSTDINSLKTLKWIPNVYLIEKPVIINCGPKTGLIVPWIGNPKIESLWLQNNPADYAFMHADFTGMKYDKFQTIEHGIENVPTTFKKIFSGHIHTRQNLNNICMVGSPYPLTRNDIGNLKGIYCVNFVDDSIDFFENTISPKFLRYSYNYVQEFSVNELRTMFGENFIDIVVPTDLPIDYSKFYELFPKVRKFKFLNERFNNDNLLIKDNESNDDVENFTDILTMCNDYVEQVEEFKSLTPERKTDVKLMLQTYYLNAIESNKIIIE